MNSLKDIRKIDPNAVVLSCQKGDVLQRPGEPNASTYLVQNGLIRSYFLDSKGKEHIYAFASEGWIIGDLDAISTNHSTELFIDCIENAQVVRFNRECLYYQDVGKDIVAQNFKMLYTRMGVLQRRVIMQMSAPATDRYQHFVKTYPALLNRIPQHMIASYLGITPQALSTIRAKIAKPL